jgi:hypothetical protein
LLIAAQSVLRRFLLARCRNHGSASIAVQSLRSRFVAAETLRNRSARKRCAVSARNRRGSLRQHVAVRRECFAIGAELLCNRWGVAAQSARHCCRCGSTASIMSILRNRCGITIDVGSLYEMARGTAQSMWDVRFNTPIGARHCTIDQRNHCTRNVAGIAVPSMRNRCTSMPGSLY